MDQSLIFFNFCIDKLPSNNFFTPSTQSLMFNLIDVVFPREGISLLNIESNIIDELSRFEY